MNIVWMLDTNIVYGALLPSDHLHLVSKCIYEKKDIILPSAVIAEIRSTYSNKIAIIFSKFLGEEEEPDFSSMDGLTKKIWKAVEIIKNHEKIGMEQALKVFKVTIQELLTLHIIKIKNAESKFGVRREIEGVKASNAANFFLKTREKWENIFKEIMESIDKVFKQKRTHKDREILKELVVLSYLYPSTIFCFFTNDEEFYKKWRKVYGEKYQEFKKVHQIKYGLFFHYIPDLTSQPLSSYKIHPMPKEPEILNMISLEKILKDCVKNRKTKDI